MKQYRSLWIFIFSLLINATYGQKENNKWVIGIQDINRNINKPDTGINLLFGLNILDFNNNSFTKSYNRKSLSMAWDVVNICDSNGNLLFYSNGSKVFNSEHKLIENADSLNYSKLYWDTIAGEDTGYYAGYIIGSYPNSMMTFQNPSNKNQYYLVSTKMNYDSLRYTGWLRFHKVVYSVIDMSLNNGKGKMIVKENELLYGDFSHAISACKHANGIDWWITARGYQDTNCYYFFKLDKTGIRYDHKQCIGNNYVMNGSSKSLSYGQIYSPNGKYFAIMCTQGVEVFDFNRCTGLFSNRRYTAYPFGDTLLDYYQLNSISFSPNSQYLYLSDAGIQGNQNMYRIFQFESMSTNLDQSMVRVARYDGFQDYLNGDTNLVGSITGFQSMQITPSNKIFIGNVMTARYLTEIEFPDKKGLACNVKQHSIKLQTYTGGVPYYPNYQLGVAKCCYNPISTTLYSSDTNLWTLDTGSYQWLYCDSNYKPVPYATKSSYKPNKSGNYAVRISNIYCTDTSDCKNIQVKSGISSIAQQRIHIYPNPARDYLQINPPLWRPQDYQIYNLLGKKMLSGTTTKEIDVSSLYSGTYFLYIGGEIDHRTVQKFEIIR